MLGRIRYAGGGPRQGLVAAVLGNPSRVSLSWTSLELRSGVLHPLPHFAWEHFTWNRLLNHRVLLVTLGLIWSYLKSLLDWSAPHWHPQLKAYFTSSWDKLDLDTAVTRSPFSGCKSCKDLWNEGPEADGNKAGRSIEPVAWKELDIQAGKVYGRNKLLHPSLHCGTSMRKGRAWQSLKLHIFQMFAPLQEAKVYISSLGQEAGEEKKNLLKEHSWSVS